MFFSLKFCVLIKCISLITGAQLQEKKKMSKYLIRRIDERKNKTEPYDQPFTFVF